MTAHFVSSLCSLLYLLFVKSHLKMLEKVISLFTGLILKLCILFYCLVSKRVK